MLACFGLGSSDKRAHKHKSGCTPPSASPSSGLSSGTAPGNGPSGLLVHSTLAPKDAAVALVCAKQGTFGPLSLACISCPPSLTLPCYAKLLSAVADRNPLFKAALSSFSDTQPGELSQPLLLETVIPPSCLTAISCDSSSSTCFSNCVRVLSTTLSSGSAATAIPALRIEHLPISELSQARPVHTIEHAPWRASVETFKDILERQRGGPHREPRSDAAQDARQQRSQIMHGEVPVLLTLFTQDGRVLEQNYNSMQFYGHILGEHMWAVGSLMPREARNDASVRAQEHSGYLEQLFSLAPEALNEVFEHLLQPSIGPWKGTIQIVSKASTSIAPTSARESAVSARRSPGIRRASHRSPSRVGSGPSSDLGVSFVAAHSSCVGRIDEAGQHETWGPTSGPATAPASAQAYNPRLSKSCSHLTQDQAAAAAVAAAGQSLHASPPVSIASIGRCSSMEPSSKEHCMERLNRLSSCMGSMPNRGAQNSRLASQLAAKMMHHSFHERALPLSQSQAQPSSEQQVVSRNTSDHASGAFRSSAALHSSTTEPSACSSFASRQLLEDEVKEVLNAKPAQQVQGVAQQQQQQQKVEGAFQGARAARRATDSGLTQAEGGFDLVDWVNCRRLNKARVHKGEEEAVSQQVPVGQPLSSTDLSNSTLKATLGSSECPTKVRFASCGGDGSWQPPSLAGRSASCESSTMVRPNYQPEVVQGFRDSKTACTGCASGCRVRSSECGTQPRLDEGRGPPVQGREQALLEQEAADTHKTSDSSSKRSRRRSHSNLLNKLDLDPPPEKPSMYHEVEVKVVTDPVISRPCFLLIQRDVTEQVELENLLSELTEDQLAMLSQIFPRHVIHALSTEGAVTLDNIADLTCSHQDVTILFLDIVSFTSTCGKDTVTPESVITFLNVLFSQFDMLVQKYQVQKIDTIGDCVVLASGILAPDQDGFWSVDTSHNAACGAGRMMCLAVDMMRTALEVQMPDGQPVQLRIGLHTGPCVSGLVGLEVPKWSIFGDTVNTAARLEQTAAPSSIQISNATKRLLPGFLDLGLVYNGAVAMKGKGFMETWLWHLPAEWIEARDARLVPPLPLSVEELYRQCSLGHALGATASQLAPPRRQLRGREASFNFGWHAEHRPPPTPKPLPSPSPGAAEVAPSPNLIMDALKQAAMAQQQPSAAGRPPPSLGNTGRSSLNACMPTPFMQSEGEVQQSMVHMAAAATCISGPASSAAPGVPQALPERVHAGVAQQRGSMEQRRGSTEQRRGSTEQQRGSMEEGRKEEGSQDTAADRAAVSCPSGAAVPWGAWPSPSRLQLAQGDASNWPRLHAVPKGLFSPQDSVSWQDSMGQLILLGARPSSHASRGSFVGSFVGVSLRNSSPPSSNQSCRSTPLPELGASIIGGSALACGDGSTCANSHSQQVLEGGRALSTRRRRYSDPVCFSSASSLCYSTNPYRSQKSLNFGPGLGFSTLPPTPRMAGHAPPHKQASKLSQVSQSSSSRLNSFDNLVAASGPCALQHLAGAGAHMPSMAGARFPARPSLLAQQHGESSHSVPLMLCMPPALPLADAQGCKKSRAAQLASKLALSGKIGSLGGGAKPRSWRCMAQTTHSSSLGNGLQRSQGSFTAAGNMYKTLAKVQAHIGASTPPEQQHCPVSPGPAPRGKQRRRSLLLSLQPTP